MTIQTNVKLAAKLSFDLAYSRFGPAGVTGNMTFCIGSMPSDATVDAITAISSSTIASNSAGVVSAAGIVLSLASASAVPPVWYWSSLPTTKTFTSTKAGTIGWCALNLSNAVGGIILVDVGLPNSGACLQVDKTIVGIGDVVTILGLSFKAWRS